jgi:hypothetical protein
MVVKPWIRLLKLDLSILLNMGTRAKNHAGVLLSLPLMATVLIFMVIVVISDLSMILFPGTTNSSLRPWMVKHQFLLVYGRKDLTSRPLSCNVIHRG